VSVGPRAARSARAALALAFAAFALSGCAWLRRPQHELLVTATAYTSPSPPAKGLVTTTAFGLWLRPGMRIIAISRDLEAMGLTRGVRIRIDGVDGEWEVGDRTAKQWTRRIDLYMGDDVDAARAFGKRQVRIHW
jgi:3D (Asp-Asp-Asp) domain-containing protein